MEKNHRAIETFERLWLLFVLGMLVFFLVVITGMLRTHGGTVPERAERIDATKVRTEGNFANPRVVFDGGRYIAYVQAFAYGYLPAEITVKKGLPVTFYVTSPDVQHGFYVENTNINIQVIPGQVAQVTYTFKRPGVYRIICNEYCGLGHQNMFGKIRVED